MCNPAVRAVPVLDRRVVVADLVDTNIALRRQQPLHGVAVLVRDDSRAVNLRGQRAVGVAEQAIAVGTALVRLSAVPEDVAALVVDLPEIAPRPLAGHLVPDYLLVLGFDLASVVLAVTVHPGGPRRAQGVGNEHVAIEEISLALSVRVEARRAPTGVNTDIADRKVPTRPDPAVSTT